jgi:type IV secretory pathway VirB10-like protein
MPNIQIERPAGAGRAWMIALLAIALLIGTGLYLTREKPKEVVNPNEVRAIPGAGSWADKETFPPTKPPQPSLPTIPPPQVSQVQQFARQLPTCGPDCEARRRLLAAAQASDISVKVPGANTLSINPNAERTIQVSNKPAPPHTLLAWTFLYAVLETPVNSDHPGDVIARVSEDARDTVTQTEVLIPMGSTLHGTQQGANRSNFNDNSIPVIWDEIVFPNGAHLAVPQMQGMDSEGYPGLSGQIDRHLQQIWGPALLVSGITAGVMLAQNPTYGSYQGYTASQQALGAAASNLGNRTTQQLDSALMNIRPTVIINAGTPIRVLVNHDFVFPGPYTDQ